MDESGSCGTPHMRRATSPVTAGQRGGSAAAAAPRLPPAQTPHHAAPPQCPPICPATPDTSPPPRTRRWVAACLEASKPMPHLLRLHPPIVSGGSIDTIRLDLSCVAHHLNLRMYTHLLAPPLLHFVAQWAETGGGTIRGSSEVYSGATGQ